MSSAFLLIAIGLLTGALAIPLVGGKIQRNGCYGFRTRLTLSSDEVWYPANRFAGRTMIVWSLFAIGFGLVSLPFSPVSLAWDITLMAIPLTILIPCFLTMQWMKRRFGGDTAKGKKS